MTDQTPLPRAIDNLLRAASRLGHVVRETYRRPDLYWTGSCSGCGGLAWAFVAVDGTTTNDAELRGKCRGKK